MSLALFAAGSAIKGISSIVGGRKANDAAVENAALMREQTDETIRRRELSDKQTEGQAVAMAAARGTGSVGGSDQAYLDFMKTENERSREFDKKMGYRGADIERQRGKDAMKVGAINAVGGAMTAGATANKWWG